MSVDSVTNTSATSTTTSSILGNGTSGEDLSNMFLELLVAQISHQNPLDPLDGTQYVSQLAEFSNVESLQSIKQNTSDSLDYMDSMMVLEATALVGTRVDVEADTLVLEQDGDISGLVNLASPADSVTVQLYDKDGELVEEQTLPYSAAGALRFNFDEQDAGTYQVRAYSISAGVPTYLSTWLSGDVERVSVGSGVDDILLQVNGLGNFTLEDTNQLAERA